MSCSATLTTNMSSSAITLAVAKVASTIPEWPCSDSAGEESLTVCVLPGEVSCAAAVESSPRLVARMRSRPRDEYDTAADDTRFALFVDERGIGERAPVADVEVQRSSLNLLNDLSQLGRVAADMDELNPHVVLWELSSRRGRRNQDATRFGDVEKRDCVLS